MKTKLSFLILAGILLLAPGCIFFPSIKGDGNVVTKTIDIAEYDEIEVEIPSATFKYTQEQGTTPALTVTVDQNIFDLYDFKTDGNKLIIRPKQRNTHSRFVPTEFTITSNSSKLNKGSFAGSLDFHVNSPLVSDGNVKLELAGGGSINLNDTVTVEGMEIELAGSGTVNAQRLSAKEFKGEAAGSGVFNLAGQGEKARFEIAGKGDVNAAGFELNEMSCEIAGSGNIETYVKENLRVNIAGSGSVRYKGDPSIKQDIAGVGSVKKMD